MDKYKCTDCPSTFSTKASLCSHRSKFHKKKYSTIAVLNPNVKHAAHSSNDELNEDLEIVSEVASEGEPDGLDTMIKSQMDLLVPKPKKRKHESDSSDDEPAPKVQRNLSTDLSDDEGSVDVPKKKKLTKKRKRVSDSSDDEPAPKVHRKRSTPTDDYQVIMKKKTVKKRKRKVRRKRKYIKYTESDKIIAEKDEEIDELKDLLKKENRRVKLYLDQLRSIENGDDRTPIADILHNRVTLRQLNKINNIIKSGHADGIQLLIDDDEMLQTIQHLFVGLNSNVIPIANPQRIALTPEQKSFIRKFEAMDIVELRRYLEKNDGEKAIHLLRILGIINDSLKLMCKTYLKYVGNIESDNEYDE